MLSNGFSFRLAIGKSFLFGALITMVAPGFAVAETGPQIIDLTQTPCQFVEPEGMDHAYESMQKADCVRINTETGGERLDKVEPMVLKPGKYIFRVTNKNVPYELGFYLRGSGLGRLTLPSTSGGGLRPGYTKDYEIELKAGEYVYSCPLNPTPDYPIVVRE
ncbi:MAG: hypothetical protein ACPHIA_04480 [Alphaproteobacteria bacterium]